MSLNLTRVPSLPTNPAKDVHRVMAHFGVSSEQEVTISSSSATSLPLGKPITLFSIFSGYVEVSQPASSRDLRALLELVEVGSKSAEYLKDLAGSYAEKVVAQRLSVLDILETHPDIRLPLGSFLEMLPSMRIRQYSISSSDVWNPQRATLTVSVLNVPAAPGRKEEFLGVASNYLATLRKGDKVTLSVRTSSAAFQPPSDPKIPLVAFCAGTGLAPMRAFIQERAVQKASGREIGKTLLFFGCRSPNEDYLYSNTDLDGWVKDGVVEVRPAFSRAPDECGGFKYVQE
jgi:cytochrome P450/NADPH-cytochrome P450 reductase